LTREWAQRRTSVLKTQHNESLSAAIELSLSSPLFQELGPDARALLEVVAFFPQGVDEKNLDWLFPTVPSRTDIFDKFCILSLTYQSNGFITMLAPLRDHLSPKDPKASPLLCATKEHYFTRMSVTIDPDDPTFGETRWIVSEDINVEHLLDVFTTIDTNSDGVWDACARFMVYLAWHKQRPTILKPKIEGLPDDHRFKPECLFKLSRVLGSVGNDVERKRLLPQALNLWREQGNDDRVADTLVELSDTNRLIGLYKEGIEQGKEALGIFKRLGDTVKQANCLIILAWSFESDGQLDAAEEAAFHAIALLPEKGEQHRVCQSHRALGDIYGSKGEMEKAIHHLEVAIGIASPFNWHCELFSAHGKLALLFLDQGRFYDAQTHLERAKPHVVNNAYYLGRMMEGQASIWYKQDRLEEAKSEALRAVDVCEKLGATKEVERCRELLRNIEKELNTPVASGQSGLNRESLQRMLFPARINSPF